MAKKKLKAPMVAMAGAITVHDLMACPTQWDISMPITANHVFFGLELMTIPFRTAPRKLTKNT
uniref:Uncharacterized protein n=1 Tax=Oryza meridionalis TaxID=40149 RepID=A0A0E0DND9_9ORYZ